VNGEKLIEGDMDFELFKKIVDEGSKNGLYAIKFSYLGEPLLCRNLPIMIAYAKKKGIIDTMFNTNGSILTEEISKRLIKAGLDKIFISFDSPNPEHYNKIRIGTNFDRVFGNVKRLAALRKKMRSITPIIRVSMTVMQENKEEVLDYIKLWSQIVDAIGFGVYVNPGNKDKEAERRSVIKIKEHKNFICSQLYQRLFIHWDGKIGLCCSDYDGSLGLGNARNVNIKDVWLGEKMKEIRNFHNQGKWKKVPLCQKCDFPYI
jgi:molybdenum cofactor biosynthesis enzyme MoaA